ncbi:ATP-dependent 6-phosphofructokinase, platelet type [Thelohanellus kitauei]|uniref:6-phosphofructokinase n=1 Tax=Thelohanellus kitauei TaxID=669202 RepID=A0A0C2J957_THEKT|nr:ATP-dependent 6-phosphofructokinase, platelet type [Thelohanellus kitauei]
MVGSIDNDFCQTDMTIGSDSALHRIIECVDSIITTAESHKRGFVVEIMGRHSGYLALCSGLAVCADYVFIPELPPDQKWKESLCRTVNSFLARGKKYAIVLVAEGAQDVTGQPITANMVKDVLCLSVKLDFRVTVLGHVQRGGSPSAFDRIMASRLGIEAAINVLVAKPDDPSYVICSKNIAIVRVPLNECVCMCNEVKEAYKTRDIDRVVSLRGPSFTFKLNLYKSLQNLEPPSLSYSGPRYKFGIVHLGAPSAGMDPCSRAFVIWCQSKGHSVIGFKQGMQGVIHENFVELTWDVIAGWFANGGSSLGASRFEPAEHMERIAFVFKKYALDGFVMVGGYDTMFFLQDFHLAREKYESLRIPVIMIPATISNNISCTTYSLGSDTTLNSIAQSCDSIRLSAWSSRKRIFIVETFGKSCAYLAMMSAISSAADNAYSLQDPPTIENILNDARNFRHKFKDMGLDFGLLLVSNDFSENYTVDTLVQIMNEEGKPYFSARKEVIGHVQQGSRASPFDRFLSAKFGSKAAEKILEMIEAGKEDKDLLMSPSTCCMIGTSPEGTKFYDCNTLIEHTDRKLRVPKQSWWFHLKVIIDILSNSDFTYQSVTIPNAVFRRVLHDV